MSDEYPTLDALVALGFERREPEFGTEAVGYRFHYLDLKASATISRYFQPDVLLSGVLNTGRTLSQIEHHLPASLGTPQEAACLGKLRSQIGPVRSRALASLVSGGRTPLGPRAGRPRETGESGKVRGLPGSLRGKP